MLAIFLGFLLAVSMFSCQTKTPNNIEITSNMLDGAQLAHKYCAGCHLFPDPQLLPKSIWMSKVMPNMATRMGLPLGFPYKNLHHEDLQVVLEAQVIPDSPMLSMKEMAEIVKFYQDSAPLIPLPSIRAETSPETDLFTVTRDRKTTGMEKNILIQPLKASTELLISFEDQGTWLYNLKTKENKRFSQVNASDAIVDSSHIFLLDIYTTKAYNRPLGKIWMYDRQDLTKTPVLVIDSLIRPVDFDAEDINNDGKKDYVVCEFGDYVGRLSLFISDKGDYKRTILDPAPGATKAHFVELDQQGAPEVLALMAQGNERIILIKNITASQPTVQNIAQFPPSFGFNSLELVDIDQDDDLDLLLTNGDNADMSSSLKKYHGVRVFHQEDKGFFRQTWFYPVHGASKAIAEDFDLDGDLDIAAIAHFPDFSQKRPEQFLYFENDQGIYNPYRLSKVLNGRLLTMAAIDINQDGRSDLILGNYPNLLTDPGPAIRESWSRDPQGLWFLINSPTHQN